MSGRIGVICTPAVASLDLETRCTTFRVITDDKAAL